MTVVIPKESRLRAPLEKSRVLCIDSAEASREDIRPLRIGILNIMPNAETYEFSLLHPLGRSVLQIEPLWIRLSTHNYGSSDSNHLRSFYITFEDAIADKQLDGLILIGAPVKEKPFNEIEYWPEIKHILQYARIEVPATMGIGWGGLALAQQLGIEKVVLPDKLFGVFEARNLDRDHCITGELDDVFLCPQNRFPHEYC